MNDSHRYLFEFRCSTRFFGTTFFLKFLLAPPTSTIFWYWKNWTKKSFVRIFSFYYWSNHSQQGISVLEQNFDPILFIHLFTTTTNPLVFYSTQEQNGIFQDAILNYSPFYSSKFQLSFWFLLQNQLTTQQHYLPFPIFNKKLPDRHSKHGLELKKKPKDLWL